LVQKGAALLSTSGLNEGLHPSFTAREATVQDLEELLHFFFAIFREPEFNDKSKDFALLETMKLRYQSDPGKHEREFFGRDKKRRFAIVVHDRKTGLLAGTAWLISNLDFDPCDDVGEINKIYLLPECRGKGLGLWLMNKMIYQAKLLGFRRISLITGRERARALSLYTKLGFEPMEQARYPDSPNNFAMTYVIKEK
jgi:GNAT superfamily N-acetyltransferase